MEHWLTTTATGLLVLGLLIIFLTTLIRVVATWLWRSYLRRPALGRLIQFLEANIPSFAISRVLTNRYMHKKDYFRYVAHTGFALTAFALSSAIQFFL
jgi:hypothetical protein